jgi:hypothetical protein
MSDSTQDDDGPEGSWTGSSDSVSETTRTSFWERTSNALFGILVGLVLIPVSAWLLFWNEGRAVQTARSLAEGGRSVVSAPADRVDRALEGRLVHVAAPLTAAGALRDAEFGVTAQGALRLVRTVEMYQWREEQRSETRTRVGGGQETVTTYSYSRAWSSSPIDSGQFRQPDGHRNPPMTITSRDVVAPEARLGPYRIEQAQLASYGTAQPLAIEAGSVPERPRQRVTDGRIYMGDPGAPRVGDLRISFGVVASGPASVIARQAGDGFAPYQTRAGDRLFMLQPGTTPAADMIREAEQGNRILTWVLRVVGLVVMFIGFALLFAPLSVVASVIPPLGSLVGFATGLVALVLTMLAGPLVIAVAWFAYRPLVGGAVLVAGLGLAFGASRLLRRRPPRVPAGPRPGGAFVSS